MPFRANSIGHCNTSSGRCAHRVDLLAGQRSSASTGSSSGQRSRVACRARRRRRGRVSPAVGVRWFRQSGGVPSLSPASLSGRYLSFEEREEISLLRARAVECAISPGDLADRRRRSPESCVAMPPPVVVDLEYRATTAQWHADRRARRPKVAKLAANDTLGSTCKIGSRARSRSRTGAPCLAPACAGSAGVMGADKIDAGQGRGVPSRSPIDCQWTSLMMNRCGSRTRPSTRPSTSRAGGRCDVSSVACLRTGRALRVPRARTRGHGKRFVTPRGHDQRAPGRS